MSDHPQLQEVVNAVKHKLEDEYLLATSGYIPLTNGRYAIFPCGRLMGGFEVSRERMEADLQKIKKSQNVSGVKFIIATIFVLLIFVLTIFVELYIFGLKVRDDIYGYVLLALVFWGAMFGFYMVWRAARVYRNDPPTRVPYRNDYQLMLELKRPGDGLLGVIGVNLIFFLAGVSLIAYSICRILGGDSSFLPFWLLAIVGCVMVWAKSSIFETIRRSLQFRKTHGRKVRLSDFKPVDPITGKMSPDPFAWPLE